MRASALQPSEQKEVLTMSAIAQKMGHTTAAASGLVARLENLGYVTRSSAREDRRKVMVCITAKGSALVRRIREMAAEQVRDSITCRRCRILVDGRQRRAA